MSPQSSVPLGGRNGALDDGACLVFVRCMLNYGIFHWELSELRSLCWPVLGISSRTQFYMSSLGSWNASLRAASILWELDKQKLRPVEEIKNNV